MIALYLDHHGLELRPDGKALALYENGVRIRSLPARLIERVVVHGELILSAGVLARLVEAGASLVFLSKRTNQRIATVLGGGHRDARIRLGHYAAVCDPVFRGRVAAALVRIKVREQRRFLASVLQQHSDDRHTLVTAIRRLDRNLDRLRTDPGMEVPSLLGIEGAAAAAYFPAYASLFAPALGFFMRVRRPPTDPVNAVLSLTYTLLHHEAIAQAHTAGLDPFLGFLHAPSYSRESLACDLVELVRAPADRWVHEVFRSRILRAEHFTRDQGRCLLGKAGRARFYPEYEKFAPLRRRCLRRSAAALARVVAAQRDGDEAPIKLLEDEASGNPA